VRLALYPVGTAPGPDIVPLPLFALPFFNVNPAKGLDQVSLGKWRRRLVTGHKTVRRIDARLVAGQHRMHSIRLRHRGVDAYYDRRRVFRESTAT
jgi:hypothetical protein